MLREQSVLNVSMEVWCTEKVENLIYNKKIKYSGMNLSYGLVESLFFSYLNIFADINFYYSTTAFLFIVYNVHRKNMNSYTMKKTRI